MNRYLIECINDCKNEFVVAYAPSMHDDNMSKAADDYAYELAISIVDEEFIVTAEGYDYEYMTDEELTKCFKCNSSLTLGWLSELTDLRDYIFKNTNLWLKPTNEK